MTTYTTGILVVVVSIIFGIFATDVNSILQWIVSALYGSYVASNVLKWYWWRFNGHGFFWGMVAGMVPALVFPYIFTETLDLYYFPLILIISIAGSIIGTYMAPPTDEDTLKGFYKNVRPWGFWKPVHELVIADDPGFRRNKNFYRDMFNVALGIIGQTGLVLAPIYLVLKKNMALGISLAMVAVIVIIMKKTWWDKLVEEEG